MANAGAVIYLLIASSGDYSDKETWVVEAFTDEAAAIEEATRLNMELRANDVMWRNYYAKPSQTLPPIQSPPDHTVVAVPIGERGKWELP